MAPLGPRDVPAVSAGPVAQLSRVSKRFGTVAALDEATSALDPETTASILALLRDINRRLGLGIALITHEMSVIRAVADEVAVLEGRCLIEQGPVAEVLTRPQAPGTRRLVLAGPAMAEAPLRVGTTAGPYAAILDYAASLAKAQGLDVKVVEFTDYTVPNEALLRGDLDASNFQHRPYLDNANRTRGYDILPLASSFVTPLGIYSQKLRAIADLPDGAEVAIPNDPSNGARALLLFQQAGLVRLRPGAGVTATVLDIEANPKRLRFRELDAAQLPRALGDVAAGAVNMNYAINAGLDPKSALATEGKDTPFGLVWTVRGRDRDDPRVAKLIGIYRSPEVKQFILDRFGGTIIPTW